MGGVGSDHPIGGWSMACRMGLRRVMMMSARSKNASTTDSVRSWQHRSRLKAFCQAWVRSTCQRCPVGMGALSPVWAISPRMLRLSISARVALGRSRHPGAQ